MMHFELFKSTSRQSKDTNLLTQTHGQATSSCTSPPQSPPPSQDHLDEIGKKGELRLVMLPQFQWWFVGDTFISVVLAKKSLFNGAIRIISKVSPTLDACFSGTILFFWIGGMAVDWRDFNMCWLSFNSLATLVNIIWITKHSHFNSVPLHDWAKTWKGHWDLAFGILKSKLSSPCTVSSTTKPHEQKLGKWGIK